MHHSCTCNAHGFACALSLLLLVFSYHLQTSFYSKQYKEDQKQEKCGTSNLCALHACCPCPTVFSTDCITTPQSNAALTLDLEEPHVNCFERCVRCVCHCAMWLWFRNVLNALLLRESWTRGEVASSVWLVRCVVAHVSILKHQQQQQVELFCA